MTNNDQAKEAQPKRTEIEQKIYIYRHKRVDEALHHLYNKYQNNHQTIGHLLNQITDAVVTLIEEECQAAVKREWAERIEKTKNLQECITGDALRSQSSVMPCPYDERQLSRASDGDATDPAARYAAYANALLAHGITNLTPGLFRAIDSIVDLSKHWGK